jgi:hypothetical protein
MSLLLDSQAFAAGPSVALSRLLNQLSPAYVAPNGKKI